ncbi:MAG: hypothetical protein JO266_00995, partial [Acidobacteria bacterium]|nr:hypothetical protein [Acidobacteriota bacterium]
RWFNFRRLSWNEWRYAFLTGWLLLPILTVFIVSQWKPCFLARYFIFTLPAMAVLAAAGIARLRSRWLMGGALLLFALWALPPVQSGYQKDLDIGREDFRAATRYILARSQPGDAILFHQPIARMPYEYYRSVTPASAYPTVVYPQHGDHLTFRDFYAGHAPEKLIEDLPPHHRRIWVVLTHNQLPTGPDPTTQLLASIFRGQYRDEERMAFAGIEVVLYAR